MDVELPEGVRPTLAADGIPTGQIYWYTVEGNGYDLAELSSEGLPQGVRVVPCYDRTLLITGAVSTVSRTLIEALLIAAVCVLLVLKHFRAWLVIAISLPFCVLGTFLAMSVLRLAGIVDIQTNIMSLAGIVISIGVLVDSSIVLTENLMHQLRLRFADQ